MTPVWIDYDADADEILVNTAEGRRKDRNVSNDPALQSAPWTHRTRIRYLSIEGRVERTTEGAVEHIDSLVGQYMNDDEYPHHGAEHGQRVIHRITPERVIS